MYIEQAPTKSRQVVQTREEWHWRKKEGHSARGEHPE
nr:MAG TPA: hypothetical protein [Caudoviricetes sp.]